MNQTAAETLGIGQGDAVEGPRHGHPRRLIAIRIGVAGGFDVDRAIVDDGLDRVADDVQLKQRIGLLVVQVIDDDLAAHGLQLLDAGRKVSRAVHTGVEHQVGVGRDGMHHLHHGAAFVVGARSEVVLHHGDSGRWRQRAVGLVLDRSAERVEARGQHPDRDPGARVGDAAQAERLAKLGNGRADRAEDVGRDERIRVGPRTVRARCCRISAGRRGPARVDRAAANRLAGSAGQACLIAAAQDGAPVHNARHHVRRHGTSPPVLGAAGSCARDAARLRANWPSSPGSSGSPLADQIRAPLVRLDRGSTPALRRLRGNSRLADARQNAVLAQPAYETDTCGLYTVRYRCGQQSRFSVPSGLVAAGAETTNRRCQGRMTFRSGVPVQRGRSRRRPISNQSGSSIRIRPEGWNRKTTWKRMSRHSDVALWDQAADPEYRRIGRDWG